MMRHALPILLFVGLVGCGGSDSGGGGGNPTGPTPTPTTYTLTGTVTNLDTGAGIVGATVTVVDGANAGKAATTTGGGSFSLTALQPGGFTLRGRAQYFNEASVGVTVTSNTSTSLALRPIPLFTRSGIGNTVFDMPTHVRRLRIIGRYSGRSTNFIIWIGGDLEVNELLGTAWGQTRYETLNAVVGGFTEIKESSGVSWSMAEER